MSDLENLSEEPTGTMKYSKFKNKRCEIVIQNRGAKCSILIKFINYYSCGTLILLSSVYIF